MQRNLILILVALGAVGTAGFLHKVDRRLGELERTPVADPVVVGVVEDRVGELAGSIEAMRDELALELERARLDLGCEVGAGRERIAELEALLASTDDAIREHGVRIASWERTWEGFEPQVVDAGMLDLRRQLEAGAEELHALSERAALMAAEEREKLAELDAALQPLFVRDTDGMWDELLGPVVQLSGETTVGSGVLLMSELLDEDDPQRSEPGIEDGDAYRTYLLTSWHVVRDIYGTAGGSARTAAARTDMPVPVKIYRVDGGADHESAQLLAYDAAIDVALLVVHTPEALPHGAALAPASRLSEVKIFDRVYAVGCPLGNDPIPTAGEVASVHHEVDGEPYWMISAPTYIGNSGGGIFDAETHELLGIFSKIYTHGSMRSAIVPHMGLATPLPTIYDWLGTIGYAHLQAPEPAHARARMASTAQLSRSAPSSQD